ncbi:hypothetical protein C0J52_15535, partial [Blattella germanica]
FETHILNTSPQQINKRKVLLVVIPINIFKSINYMDKKKSKAEASRKGTSKKTESEKESVTATVTITDSIVEDDQQVVDNKPIKIRVNAVENLKVCKIKLQYVTEIQLPVINVIIRLML